MGVEPTWKGTPALDLTDLVEVDPALYEMGPEIGGGGMGRIVAARDRRLGRVLAVKLLRPGSRSLALRFENEARITARLQHPAIVNIHEAGRWLGPRPQAGGVEDPVSVGEPFYAMKLVAGRSLDEEVAAARTLAERVALLPRVATVAEALAYAHGQGVIHRDLKPHNVMVGEYGETVVIDWGLAKDLKTAGASPAAAGVGGPISHAYDTAGRTAVGAVLGTPAYMPPEQAGGRPVDARADVYAIGALLYHVLSGQVPYGKGGASVAVVLSGPPRPLEELEPGLPPDLVAIVQKAMARAPGDRYPTAKELAEDLRRFVAGRRVAVHHYSPWQRAARFARRHRAALGVLAVMLAVLAATGALSFRRVLKERDRAEGQRALAEQSRQQAQDQRRAAEGLVEFMVFTLRDRLEPVGRLDLLEGIASTVADYYRSVSTSEVLLYDDGRRRRAEALHILGGVELRRGYLDAALTAFQTSLALADKSPASAPEVARIWRMVGGVYLQKGERAAALDAFWRADDVLEEALPRPAPVALLWRIAGQKARAGGDLEGAMLAATYERAIAIEALAVEHAGDDKMETFVGDEWADVGRRELVRGHLDESIAAVHKALAANQRLAHPDLPSTRQTSALAWSILAEAELDKHHVPAAREAARKALALRQKLAEAAGGKDNTAEYELARAWRTVGWVEDRGRNPPAARSAYQQSIDILTRLTAGDPDNTFWQAALADSWSGLSLVESQAGRLDAAQAALRHDIEIGKRLLDKDPTSFETQRSIAASWEELAYVQSTARDTAGALASLRESLPVRERLHDAHPADLEPLLELATTLEGIGSILVDRSERAAARDSYRRCLDLLGEGGDPRRARVLAACAGGMAVALAPAAAARPFAERALRVLEDLARGGELDQDARDEEVKLRALLARLR